MKIDMSHGSGGKASAELMNTIFAKHLHNPVLDRMEDAAVLELHGKVAVSTDTFVVHPIFFKGGDIGKLAVCGTVNDLLVMGAEPRYLTAGFILEEGLDLVDLERIVISMAKAAKEAGVLLIAGDTKVVEGNGGLFINTTGIGIIPTERDLSASHCRDTDVILLSGTLGDHHACILSQRMEIDNSIESDCALLSDVTRALFEAGVVVRAMRDVTRGGLGTVLNELSSSSKSGVLLQELNIPVGDEVRGFCGIMGLDPLYMGNEGKLVAVVAEEDAERALEAMRRTANGTNAAIIGKFQTGQGVYIKTRLGGTRKIDMLYGEGLPRIC